MEPCAISSRESSHDSDVSNNSVASPYGKEIEEVSQTSGGSMLQQLVVLLAIFFFLVMLILTIGNRSDKYITHFICSILGATTTYLTNQINPRHRLYKHGVNDMFAIFCAHICNG
eukprot:GHVL01004534.1.p1 GENE.GHVL01004534.1~~GHVL01004534.1.p1  ORF type:complete len:115 (+),score=7.83 GHVL01004534.1:374-718(+)